MVALALLLAQVGAAQAAPPQEAPHHRAVPSQELREEELLLLSVTLDGRTLTESLGAYGDPADPLLPIGELSRLLGFDLSVLPQIGQVQGNLGESRRALLVDLAVGVARVGGGEIPVPAAQAGRSPTDLFFRASLLQRLLPITLAIDGEQLLLAVTATEALPIQSAAERDQRLRRLEQGPRGQDPVLRIPTGYALASAPAIDVALESGYDSRRDLTTRRYDVRAAADLMRMGFTGYLGSDERGRPANLRMKLDRRSADGRLLGPLGATYFALGDVFTPLMTLGPDSIGGRGFSFTTTPLGQANVFQRVTLRGELPIGYQVELYVNDVLRGGQRFPVEGRYEFLDVPLSRGLNVLRIVTYGPNGERSEQSRVLNVGGGQLEQGQFTVDFGAVQEDQPVIDLSPDGASAANPSYGHLRAVARLAYGLRDELTLVGGAALYSDVTGEQRRMLSVGARGSLLGVALLGDAARDFSGGTAVQLGAAGEFAGISATLRHAEYGGGFVDETNRLYDGIRPLQRATAFDATFSLPGPGRARIPVSVHAERTRFADSGAIWLGVGRASTILADTLVSTGLDYRSDSFPNGSGSQRLSGNFAASRFFAYVWQLRAVADYDLAPDARLLSLSLTADRNLSDTFGIHLGVGKLFGRDDEFQLQGAGFLHLPFGDLALTGDYATRTREWRLGLRLAFGLVLDPWARRPRLVRAGAATGGSAAVQAFLDSDADGRPDPGEGPIAGVRLTGGERPVTTNARGEAFISGLGDSVSAMVHADSQGIDAFYVNSPPQDIELSPRPGQIVAVAYPFTPVGEVLVRLWLARPDGKRVGVSAVQLRLVREDGLTVAAASEFDGSAVFEDVRPGAYRVELDREQAARLGMRLKDSAAVVLRGELGSPQVDAEILFGEKP